MDAGQGTDAPPRVIGLFFALCTIASGLFGAGFWLLRDRGPTAEAYFTAASKIRSGWQEGDLVLIVPSYATRPREHLGDLEVAYSRDPLSEDLRKYKRVWVIGSYGERLPETPGLELLEGGEAAPGVNVDLYRVASPWDVTFDFVRQIKSAVVYHEHDGREELCARWEETNAQGGKFGRWVCPHDGEWFYVAPEFHRMGDSTRFCLWAHPPNSGRIVIRYPNVPLTGHFYGRAGHTLNGSVYARERIFFDVQVGSAAPQRFDLALEEHWRPIALETPKTGTATITFAVSTPDAGANHFCFAADVRRPL